MDAFPYEVRHAARALALRPGLTGVAVLTLALGIGGATAIFSVADAVVLKALPYASPDRLVVLWQSDRSRNQPFVEISYPAFREWRDRTHLFESIAAMPSVNTERTLTGRAEPATIEGRDVTGGFFSLLGVSPALGRVLLPQDERVGAPGVVVLSQVLWQDRFGSDPGILGAAMVLDGRPYTIVGVMPAGFQFPKGARFWIPLQPSDDAWAENVGLMWMIALGRLKPGTAIEPARNELTELWRQMYAAKAADTGELAGYRTVVTPLRDVIFGPARPALIAVLAAGILVLLIACANVAGLLMVQATDRRRDMAVRHALGASRGRLVRVAFIESLLIASLAGVGGLAAAWLATPLIIALSPADLPRVDDVAVNLRAFGFAVAAAALAAILSSLAPMVLVRRASIEGVLRQTTSRIAPGGGRLGAALVVAEVAIAVILLVGAGLLARSYLNLRLAPLGFEPGRVLAVTVSLPEGRSADIARVRAFYRELLNRVGGLPGVASAAAITRRPLWSTVGYDWIFTIEGQTEQDATRNPMLNMMAVTSDYFTTMGITVKRGRVFTDEDADGQPGVVVISESLAARTWPGLDPIGKRLKIPLSGTPYHNSWLTVIGVVADARYREIQAARLDFYMSYLQADHRLNSLMVRSERNPAALTRAVVAAVHDLDPSLPVGDAVTMARIVSETLGGPRFAVRLFAAFAVVALSLAALGVYTLLAYSVTSRTREIGVRIALGARSADIMGLIFRHGLGLTALGLVSGLLAAAVGTRLIAALLYEVPGQDPLTFIVAPLVLGSAAGCACLIPALRATRVDPVCALRGE
ncbi:MAG: ABC transporter permease [Acidobacteriota bacterium]